MSFLTQTRIKADAEAVAAAAKVISLYFDLNYTFKSSLATGRRAERKGTPLQSCAKSHSGVKTNLTLTLTLTLTL